MLGSGFFEAREVQENRNGTFTVRLLTRTPEEDAAVQALRPGRGGVGGTGYRSPTGTTPSWSG